jgi:hypothetical protein
LDDGIDPASRRTDTNVLWTIARRTRIVCSDAAFEWRVERGARMSTIHLHQTTTSTPEQFVAALTDFGPGRSKLFGNSADEYLKVHHRGPTEADVTEGSAASGSACTTTGPIPTASS